MRNEDCSACRDIANADVDVDREDAATPTTQCPECLDKEPRHVVFHHLADFMRTEYGGLEHLHLLTSKQVSESTLHLSVHPFILPTVKSHIPSHTKKSICLSVRSIATVMWIATRS